MNGLELAALPFRRRMNVIHWAWMERMHTAMQSLDPAAVLDAMDRADRDLVSTTAPARKFGPEWGTGAEAQAGQDAALALAGISVEAL